MGYPRSSEFQSEGNAVEPAADLHDGPGIAGVEDEVRPDIMGAVEEEPYRGETSEPVGITGVRGLGKFQ